MRLSTAIRLGAMLKPKALYAIYRVSPPRTCALGAALDAAGQLEAAISSSQRRHVEHELTRLWPVLNKLVQHPGAAYHQPFAEAIAALNDHQQWSRERIADWVEQIELANEVKPEPRLSEEGVDKPEPQLV